MSNPKNQDKIEQLWNRIAAIGPLVEAVVMLVALVLHR
jgi:hypothetical protein